ncbi:MAG: hypothetical protein GWN14_15355 [candidate division Zixibacteria bacterium]|nr:hypothetical protein [candidate division Zixibacteria bacterium]
MPFGELLSQKLLARDPQEMTDVEIEAELERLFKLIADSNFSIDLKEGLPARLPARFVYTIVREVLGEEFEFIAGGGGHIDGCSSVCPECLQHPWCETGQDSCREEDEQAGAMAFPEEVRRYVSPSPVSLALLRQSQQEHDERMKPYLDPDSDVPF